MRSVLALALLVPSLAAAGGSFTPPKGWIRDKPYEAKALPKLAKQYGDSAKVSLEVWRAKDNGGDPSISGQLAVFSDASVIDDVDGLLGDMVTALEPKLLQAGWAKKPATAPKKKGLKAEVRAYEGQGRRVIVAAQAISTGKGLLTYGIVCFEDASMDVCANAVASTKLSK